MADWKTCLNGDPMPWLLEDRDPAVKHAALRQLLDRPPEDGESGRRERRPWKVTLLPPYCRRNTRRYWVKPGAGYGPKYRGTVWQVIFLDQLGADGADERMRAACEYVLSHTQTAGGGFGCSAAATEAPPPPSVVLHCLNGNLLRALIGFGWLEDERVQRAIDWQARSITGEGSTRFYQSSIPGPGFLCSATTSCRVWGAVKAMLALARVPADKRAPHVQRAVEHGIEFLLSRDPAKADYPMGWGNAKPNGSWFKLGFPSGYVADVLQNLDALSELGLAKDLRLDNAVRWLLSKQDRLGRWKNEYAYNGKTWVDFEKQGEPSKWVTLRACRVLKAVYG